uniref:MBD domain-containing protein n=1 Tax=Strigamia maritima TaxID=126957 RepID=T1IUX2_STRMM
MGTRGFRIWDPVSNNVYESKHVKLDETRLYKDVVQTHVGESPFETSVGKNVFARSPSDTSDTDDEDTTPPHPRHTPTRLPPPIPAPAAQKFAEDTPICIDAKGVPVSTTPLKPTRVAHRALVPNKPGWEREEVQRQSGATKGQWDVYYYAPGLRTALRSRPDIKAYCETNLKVKYKADDYDFNPTHAVDSDSDDDAKQPRDPEVEPETDNGEAETYSVRVYCAKVPEPSTYKEAMLLPEIRDYNLSRAFYFLPRFSQDGACEVLLPINKLFYMFGPFKSEFFSKLHALIHLRHISSLSAAAESLYAAEEVCRVTSPIPRRSA